MMDDKAENYGTFLPSEQNTLALNQHFFNANYNYSNRETYFLLKEQISNQNDKILIINSIRKIL